MRTKMFEFTTACFKCNDEIVFVTPDMDFSPSEDKIACRACALKMGDRTMWHCWWCGKQFQLDTGFRGDPETCSDDCGDKLQDRVDRSIEREYDSIERSLERRLEAL